MSHTDMSKMWISYTEDGDVYTIAHEQEPGYKHFEMEVFLLEKFLTGQKRTANYNIEHFFNISKGLEVEDDVETVKKSDVILYLIPVSDIANTEITIEHNKEDSKWTVSCRAGIKEKLDIMPTMNFFVCKQDDPHFLYTYFAVNPVDLKESSIDIPFTVEEEQDLNQISLATQLKFKSYRIKELT